MSEHDPDRNPSLDEIESMAAVAAHFWLGEARRAVESECGDAGHYPAGIVGFTIASAINYHAERQVDAAMKIAEGLQAIAAAIKAGKGATP